VLEVRGLVKRFGGLTATDRVELSVLPGEVHALIGPNGAGKTTLIAQLAGQMRSDAGHILLGGRDVTRAGPRARVLAGMARSFQVTAIFRDLTVADNIRLAMKGRAAVADLLRPFGLAGREGIVAGMLAYGEQRQLEIAMACAQDPGLLLLDEPLAGMGPEEARRLVALLGTLKGGRAMLLVEHDMEAVFALADRISVLVAGRIIATGTPSEIRGNAAVRDAYLGHDEEDAA
jgi:branched-chain amino acid transport system ATP-binding protein